MRFRKRARTANRTTKNTLVKFTESLWIMTKGKWMKLVESLWTAMARTISTKTKISEIQARTKRDERDWWWWIWLCQVSRPGVFGRADHSGQRTAAATHRVEQSPSGRTARRETLLQIARVVKLCFEDSPSIPLHHKGDEPFRAPHILLVPQAYVLPEDVLFHMDTLAQAKQRTSQQGQQIQPVGRAESKSE
jgi:hypothetical protein